MKLDKKSMFDWTGAVKISQEEKDEMAQNTISQLLAEVPRPFAETWYTQNYTATGDSYIHVKIRGKYDSYTVEVEELRPLITYLLLGRLDE